MQTLADLMTRDVLAVAPEDTIGEAAQLMTDRGVGSAVVSDFGRLIGILTERDLLRAVADGVDMHTALVAQYMTPNAVTVTPQWHVVDAARTMLDRHFRHLVVVDDGQTAGILSVRDIVRCWTDDGASCEIPQERDRFARTA